MRDGRGRKRKPYRDTEWLPGPFEEQRARAKGSVALRSLSLSLVSTCGGSLVHYWLSEYEVTPSNPSRRLQSQINMILNIVVVHSSPTQSPILSVIEYCHHNLENRNHQLNSSSRLMNDQGRTIMAISPSSRRAGPDFRGTAPILAKLPPLHPPSSKGSRSVPVTDTLALPMRP